MTDTELLREVIKSKGLKLEYIAKKLHITRFSLQKKTENTTEFKASEIQKLCEVLQISDPDLKERIFFAQNVENNSTKEVMPVE